MPATLRTSTSRRPVPLPSGRPLPAEPVSQNSTASECRHDQANAGQATCLEFDHRRPHLMSGAGTEPIRLGRSAALRSPAGHAWKPHWTFSITPTRFEKSRGYVTCLRLRNAGTAVRPRLRSCRIHQSAKARRLPGETRCRRRHAVALSLHGPHRRTFTLKSTCHEPRHPSGDIAQYFLSSRSESFGQRRPMTSVQRGPTRSEVAKIPLATPDERHPHRV